MNNENNQERLNKLKEEAANQYVAETKNEKPSIGKSDVTMTNGTEIVILRDKQEKIVAHYQLLKEYKFHRLDK